jgi:hypothetical protein
MIQTVTDMVDGQSSRVGRIRIWLLVAADLPVSIIHQNVLTLEGTLMDNTPSYIKLSGLLSGLLLMPFVLALVANSISVSFFGHSLYQTWVWSTPFLGLWVFILPSIALAVAVISYGAYLVSSTREKKRPLKTILDLRATWPILSVGLVALGILFMLRYHDSGQCITHNLSSAVQHLQQTWECIQNK